MLQFKLARKVATLSFFALALTANAHAQWKYSSSKDEMRGTSTRRATLSSQNSIQLGFPYRGGSKLELTVRKRGEDSPDVFLFIDRGQIPCHDDCAVNVKFDDEEVMAWSGTGPDSGKTSIIFLNSEPDFIEKLKNTKQLFVEVSIYDHGRGQFKFNTKGLKWSD